MPDVRPNILIFLVDQMPYDYTRPDHPCRMPNLQRCMDEGLTFTRAMTSSPHCCPSRATFMTGLYPTRHGVFNNVNTRTAHSRGLRPGVRCWSDGLKNAGYRLAYSGKWHVSDEASPADHGFKELTEFKKHFTKTYAWEDRTHEPPEADRPRRSGEVLRPGWGNCVARGPVLDAPDAYETAHYYKNGVKPGVGAIGDLAKGDGPWALVISTDMTHSTGVPREIADLYTPGDAIIPDSFADTLEDKPRVYQRMRHQIWGQLTEDEVRDAIVHYYAVCSLQDRYFGEILDALDATGQADDTLVLFLSDHGDFSFAHGLIELGIPSFREVYNVPAVMRWPNGIEEKGRQVDDFVSLADFAPTFTELSGRRPDANLTGRSLAPFLRGENPDDWTDAWFGQSNGNEVYYTQRIVQTDRYKYVYNAFDFDELYDLHADPHEMTNLAFPDRMEQHAPHESIEHSTETYTPWPRLSPELEGVRRDLLARMWRFARDQEDIIFSSYPPVALAPYGPLVALDAPKAGDHKSV